MSGMQCDQYARMASRTARSLLCYLVFIVYTKLLLAQVLELSVMPADSYTLSL